jgi:hypothetical protein
MDDATLSLLATLLLSILSIVAAAYVADWRGRSRKAWMWAAAILGPFPLLALLLMPSKKPAAGR